MISICQSQRPLLRSPKRIKEVCASARNAKYQSRKRRGMSTGNDVELELVVNVKFAGRSESRPTGVHGIISY